MQRMKSQVDMQTIQDEASGLGLTVQDLVQFSLEHTRESAADTAIPWAAEWAGLKIELALFEGTIPSIFIPP